MAVVNHRTVYISIHALREEGDVNGRSRLNQPE